MAPPDRQLLEGPLPLQTGRELRHQRRADRDRRRVHRPPDGRPPVERRAAPGRRGEGRGQGQGRNPNAGHDHAAELLQALHQDLRHDRHRHDRGQRVLENLQARCDRDPDQPSLETPGTPRRDLLHGGGEVRGGGGGDRADPQVGRVREKGPQRAVRDDPQGGAGRIVRLSAAGQQAERNAAGEGLRPHRPQGAAGPGGHRFD